MRIPDSLANFYNNVRACLAREESQPPRHIKRILEKPKTIAETIFHNSGLNIEVVYTLDEGKWGLGFVGRLQPSEFEKFEKTVETIEEATGYSSFFYQSSVILQPPVRWSLPSRTKGKVS